jgi:hypothetical protein
MVERAGSTQVLTAQDDLKAGDLVTTGAASQVEVLLNPGSYLRVGENSAFEFVDNSLANLRVRLAKGSAIVEATGTEDAKLNITVLTPQLSFLIERRGVYRINVGSAASTELLVQKGSVVLDGQTAAIKSGTKITFGKGSFVTAKLTKSERDEFDDWSKERANTLAKANYKLSARGLNSYFANTSFEWAFSAANPYGFWAFSPFARCYTFLPFYYGWSSPYGHSYGLYFDRYDFWLQRGGCCGRGYSPVIVSNPSSSGSSGGGFPGSGSSGGSGGSIGPSRPPAPPSPGPSQAGPRDPDSGSRSINRIKDPIN